MRKKDANFLINNKNLSVKAVMPLSMAPSWLIAQVQRQHNSDSFQGRIEQLPPPSSSSSKLGRWLLFFCVLAARKKERYNRALNYLNKKKKRKQNEKKFLKRTG